MYELNKDNCKCNYKNIYLDTRNATANTTRTEFAFDSMPMIKLNGVKNVLKVKSVSLTGAGAFTGHTWIVKMRNIKYNTEMYFNSDRGFAPTIIQFKDDSVNAFNTGSVLEVEPQDINQIVLEVVGYDNTATSHGLVKNTNQNIDMWLSLCVEEYME